jgi:hypothetical protein
MPTATGIRSSFLLNRVGEAWIAPELHCFVAEKVVQSLSVQARLSFVQIKALPGPKVNLLDSITYGFHAEPMCKPLHMTCPNMFPFIHI